MKIGKKGVQLTIEKLIKFLLAVLVLVFLIFFLKYIVGAGDMFLSIFE
jgi:hypothetical protein